MKRWYEKPLRVFDLALEDPYGQWLDRWTAEGIVDLVRETGANVLNMMIVNEWGQAYFKARHLPLHPQLNGSDRLAEVLEHAHEQPNMEEMYPALSWSVHTQLLLQQGDVAAAQRTNEISQIDFDPDRPLTGGVVYTPVMVRMANVGVALGRDRFAHASTSRGVVIDRLMDDYFARRFVEARRVLDRQGG